MPSSWLQKGLLHEITWNRLYFRCAGDQVVYRSFQALDQKLQRFNELAAYPGISVRLHDILNDGIAFDTITRAGARFSTCSLYRD